MRSHGQAFSDAFSSSTFEDRANGYLGGFYGSNVAFEQWFGSSVEAGISGGSLHVESSSGLRGAFLVLAPSVFGSDTEFSLTLDVTSLDLGAGGISATARVFTGTGYDLTLSSASALFINARQVEWHRLGALPWLWLRRPRLPWGPGKPLISRGPTATPS